MKTLETNDWIILNTIIYKVYTMEDFDEMRKELLEQLKTAGGFLTVLIFIWHPWRMKRNWTGR